MSTSALKSIEQAMRVMIRENTDYAVNMATLYATQTAILDYALKMREKDYYTQNELHDWFKLYEQVSQKSESGLELAKALEMTLAIENFDSLSLDIGIRVNQMVADQYHRNENPFDNKPMNKKRKADWVKKTDYETRVCRDANMYLAGFLARKQITKEMLESVLSQYFENKISLGDLKQWAIKWKIFTGETKTDRTPEELENYINEEFVEMNNMKEVFEELRLDHFKVLTETEFKPTQKKRVA